ncbi:MAG: PilZ domain-containing protein [Planctomycetota bacterium]
MSAASLRYVDPDSNPTDSYFFERRSAPRRKMNGRVTALMEPSKDGGGLKRICSLTLVDGSANGLGGRCDQEIQKGTRLSVFFPPHGYEAGFAMGGQVVNCWRDGSQWRVGIRLDETVGRLAG